MLLTQQNMGDLNSFPTVKKRGRPQGSKNVKPPQPNQYPRDASSHPYIGGHRWDSLGGGDGYEPLSARLHLDAHLVPAHAEEKLTKWLGYTNRMPELSAPTRKARDDFFKSHDPWAA